MSEISSYKISSSIQCEYNEEEINGQYKLEKTCGEGGFGKVIKAIDLHDNKFVAVKKFIKQKNVEDENYVNYVKEYNIASSLKHQNIVRALDFFSTDQSDDVHNFRIYRIYII